MSFSRQRYGESGSLKENSPTYRRSRSAYGCSKSSTPKEGDGDNLDEQSKTRQGILVI